MFPLLAVAVSPSAVHADSSVGLLLLYVGLALSVSFLCSVMEAVLLSVTPAFVANVVRERPRLGRRLRTLKSHVDKPLAAILSLNTIAHTVGAAGAGAQAAAIFGDAYVGLISAILTLLILVLSEIIPKTIGAVYWRHLTAPVTWILAVTIPVMWPLVKLADLLTWLVARRRTETLVRREEFLALAKLGEQEGVLNESESRILTNLFRFGKVTAADIMTPRTVMCTMPMAATVSDAVAAPAELRFSRIPLFRTSPDELVGFVLKADMLLYAAQQRGSVPLKDLSRDLMFVPATMTLQNLFTRMMKERAHIAAVIGEYGGIDGLVTMEDIVETLLGLEIVDEVDSVDDMQELARKLRDSKLSDRGLTEGLTEDPQ